MPTRIRIDEQDRMGQHDIHELEIASSEDGRPRPLPQQAENIQTDVPPLVTIAPPVPPRRNSISEGAGNDVAFEGRNQLIVVDQFVQFRPEPNSPHISGVFSITNVSQYAEMVIFKVKTTNIVKFQVRPTIGVIKGRNAAQVTIKVLEGETMESIAHEGFLVQGMVLPLQYHASFSSSESDSGDAGRTGTANRLSPREFAQLNSLWKEIADVRGTYIEEHRMKVRITLPPPPVVILPPAVVPPPSIPERAPVPIPDQSDIQLFQARENELRRRLTVVQETVTTTGDNIESSTEWNTLLIYGLYVLIMLCFVISWLAHRNPSKSEPHKPSIPIPPTDIPAAAPTPTPSAPPKTDWTCLGW